MTTKQHSYFFGLIVVAVSLSPVFLNLMCGPDSFAQASAAVSAARQVGTVKNISGTGLTIATDAGQTFTVSVASGARILQLTPGSTDLKTAQAIALADIEVGDRVLVTGRAGDAADSISASRVILMKSSDITQKHTTEQADWQKRGMGGIVNVVDPVAGTLTLSSGAKKVQVQTAVKTIFRRYARDSIKFEDAKPGTLAQIHAGDQVEVRGAKSDDGMSLQAEEVVSGSFRNLSGTLATVNPAAGTVTLKDLATKKVMTVIVTGNSDLRKLPLEVAARFAARERSGSGGRPTSAEEVGAPRAPTTSTSAESGTGAAVSGEQSGRSAGLNLSKMLAHLPSATLTDLHPGDAVMIVASDSNAESQPGSERITAVTLLSGVEPILAAAPSGSGAMTLSPWNVGGGAPEGGGTP